MKRFDEAKVQAALMAVVRLNEAELSELNRRLSGGGPEATGVREPRRPPPLGPNQASEAL